MAAQEFLRESLALRHELEDQRGIANASNYLGRIACDEGNPASARALLEEALILRRGLGDSQGMIESLEAFAFLSAFQAQPARATQLFSAAAALRQSRAIPVRPVERREQDPAIGALRRALGENDFATCWQKGQAMTWEEAAAYALEEEPAQ
jgi:non-specific serine/threonine protein kinase